MSAATVHVVDDDDEVRAAMGRLLRAEGYAVCTYASAGEFLLAAPGEGPGCLVLDLELPGPSGLDLQQGLHRLAPGLPIVFVTGRGDVPSSVRAMKAGAIDFLTKPVEPDVLIVAIEAALAQARSTHSRQERVGDASGRYATLSAREREVLEHVVAGRLNKQTARALGSTERTVKMHRAQGMAKMQVGSVAELVQVAGRLAQAGVRAEGESASNGKRGGR